jgi:hypothetical protein
MYERYLCRGSLTTTPLGIGSHFSKNNTRKKRKWEMGDPERSKTELNSEALTFCLGKAVG